MKFNFEQAIRALFDSYEPQVTEGLFEQILAKRNQAKKRKKMILWGSVALLLLTFSSSIFWWTQVDRQEHCDAKPKNATKASEMREDNNISQNKKEVEFAESTEAVDPSVAQKSGTLRNSELNVPTTRGNFIKTNQKSVLVNEEINLRNNVSATPKTSAASSDEIDLLNFDKTNNELNVARMEQSKEMSSAELEIIRSDELASDYNLGTSTEDDELGNTPKKKNDKLPRPPKKTSPWSITLLQGVGNSGRRLTGDNVAMIAERERTEKISIASNTRLTLNYRLGKYWEVSSGAAFGIRNVNIYGKSRTTSYEIVGGDTVKYITNTNIKDKVSHKSLRIPLAVSRYIYWDKLFLVASAGMSADLVVSDNTSWFESEGKYVTRKDIPLRDRGQIRWNTAVGAGYRINNKYSFIILPQFEFSSNRITDPYIGIKQKDITMFTNFGVKMDF